MSRRREAEPLQKITISVFASDFDRFKSMYPIAGHNKAFRALLRQHIQRVAQRVEAMVDTSVLDEVEIEL